MSSVFLGNNQALTSNLNLQRSQALQFTTTPDTRVTQQAETTCQSTEDATHEAVEKAAKFRHFNIKGDIVVSERVSYKEEAASQDRTDGVAEKTTVEVQAKESGDLGVGDTRFTLATNDPLTVD